MEDLKAIMDTSGSTLHDEFVVFGVRYEELCHNRSDDCKLGREAYARNVYT
ncbi:hypothetical protein PEM37_39280 [Streptomyces sp. AD681]|uniref:hypothetical protein n=1 Tax=Streptomyces sp. AD681 TaxID=3019069 RepID=UPI0022F19BA4|nr:hypothetical protein [Streptomyces sp. AD681]MDA5147545.1 hypothetical protein [Streptomyces sp. AD681]